MTGFVANIEKETLENSNFRKVLYTGEHAQLVVMCLQVGENIGMEVHQTVDQFFRIEQGNAKVIMNGEESSVEKEYAFIVPAGTQHDVVNTGDTELKLYTIYSPANHPDGTIHVTKAEAEEYEKSHHE
jgi:mannose-6-phosphate isomerase-like protein (cupin superfamily)